MNQSHHSLIQSLTRVLQELLMGAKNGRRGNREIRIKVHQKEMEQRIMYVLLNMEQREKKK